MPINESLLKNTHRANYGTILPADAVVIPMPPPAAVAHGWGHQIANYFGNMSLTQKVATIAVGTGLIIGLSATVGGAMLYYQNSHNIMNWSAQEICSRLPESYLQWSFAPAITTLQANLTQTVHSLCTGSPLTDPAMIAAANATLNHLKHDLANQSTLALTGHFYNPLNPYPDLGIPTQTYQLIHHCLSDYMCSGEGSACSQPWFYPQVYVPLINGYLSENQITLENARQITFGGLKALCNRLGVEPLFSASNYTCGPVERISDAIKYVATFKSVWPS